MNMEIDKNQNNSFKGWLFSDSLIKRSLAVVGHYIIGQLIICVVLGIPLVLIALLLHWIF